MPNEMKPHVMARAVNERENSGWHLRALGGGLERAGRQFRGARVGGVRLEDDGVAGREGRSGVGARAAAGAPRWADAARRPMLRGGGEGGAGARLEDDGVAGREGRSGVAARD